MKKTELVFIPAPGIGHLVSTVELANELVSRDDRFSAMVLVIKSPFELSSSPLPTNSQANIQYFEVPKPLQLPPLEFLQESLEKYISLYIESHKSHVKDIIVNHFSNTTSFQLSGLVVDMFCVAMIDVANELEVPSYLFFTSGAGFLGFTLYLHSRRELGGAEFEESVLSPTYRVMPTQSWRGFCLLSRSTSKVGSRPSRVTLGSSRRPRVLSSIQYWSWNPMQSAHFPTV